MNLEIFDNFLPQQQFQKLSETIMSNRFPWFFTPGKSNDKEAEENIEIFQFSHVFYEEYSWKSPFADILDPFVQTLQPISIVRIKANLTTITKHIIQYSYHRDAGLTKMKTACFYVNTNNGSTIFNSGEEIKSVANRLIIFDSDNLHTGTSCTDEQRRIVINFNYFSYYS